MKIKNFAIMAVLLSTASLALADQTPFYAGVSGGSTFGNSDVFSPSQLTSVLGGSAAVSQSSNVAVGRIFGGYKFTPNISAELGYFGSGNLTANFAGISGGGTPYSGSVSASTNGLDLSFIGRPSELPGLFARLGVHSSQVKANATINVNGSFSSASASKNGSGLMFGFGYDQEYSNNWTARVEYTRYNKLGGVEANENILSVAGIYRF